MILGPGFVAPPRGDGLELAAVRREGGVLLDAVPDVESFRKRSVCSGVRNRNQVQSVQVIEVSLSASSSMENGGGADCGSWSPRDPQWMSRGSCLLADRYSGAAQGHDFVSDHCRL